MRESGAVPVVVEGPRGLVRLKWHKLRTRFAEAPFKPANLALGWRLGASLEVDILTAAEGRFAVLHDWTLGPSTTGRGRVSDTPLAAMEGLLHRDRAGVADAAAPVRSLADLVAPLATLPRAPATSLQFDLKVREGSSLPDAAIEEAAAVTAEFEDAIEIGSLNLEQARRLAATMPKARLGYDPQRAVERSPELARSPEALLRHLERRRAGVTTAYLRFDLVLTAVRQGFPLVDRLTDMGIRTDAWTLNPGPRLLDDVLRGLLTAGISRITTDDPPQIAHRVARLGLSNA